MGIGPSGARVRARAIAALLLVASGAQAQQVQRSFINQSFEQPVTCSPIDQVPSDQMPGWETTHGTRDGLVYCGGAPATYRPIETWQSGSEGVLTAPGNGNQFVELNAFEASRMYQTVCLVPGERVSWQLDHRGRSGADEMSFNIGSDPGANGAVEIVRVVSDQSGGGSIVAGSCGISGTCSQLPSPGNGWSRYAGEFTWNGPAGEQTVGFEAVAAAGGVSSGNFLDGINLVLRPYVELFPADASTSEGQGTEGVPVIRVVGVVGNPFEVRVNITGGTALRGIDYTAPGSSFLVTIPAGDYGAGQDFPLPLEVRDDSNVEGVETVELELVPDLEHYNIGSTAVCGAPANAAIIWRILDDEPAADLVLVKSANVDTAVTGQELVYTLAVSNNGPLAADGAVLTDMPPSSGLDCSSGTLTCGNASGGAACPASPDVDDLVGPGVVIPTLPAGGALEFQLTCTVTAEP